MDTTYILTLIVVINAISAVVSNLSSPRRPLNATVNALVGAVAVALYFILPVWSGLISLILLIAANLALKKMGRPQQREVPVENQELREAPVQAKQSVITMVKVLIAANVIGFVVEIFFGASDDAEKLVALGAVYTPLVVHGEWWRLLSAQYLHFGALHLVCNMIGLSALGPFVERVYGKVKFLVLYTIAGTAGLSTVVAMYYFKFTEQPAILIGASAGVLGLVGMTGGFLSRLYLKNRAAVHTRQLRAVGQILLLQIIFDSMVPQVSSTAHLGGAFFGFLLGFCVPERRGLFQSR